MGHGIQDDRWNDYKKFKGEGVVMFLDGEPPMQKDNPKSLRMVPLPNGLNRSEISENWHSLLGLKL